MKLSLDIKIRNSFPAIVIALFLVISFIVIALGHVIFGKPLLLLNYLDFPGLDYIDYFRASENILDKLSPYDIVNTRYVTSPIPALLNTIFVPLGFERARSVMFILIACSVVFSIFLSTSMFPFSKLDKRHIFLGGLVSLLFSYPFYFLLYRANIDGWVLLLLCLGLIFIQIPRKEWLSGFFISLAIMFKIYPVLILLPIVLLRRWRLFLWCFLWVLIWGIVSSFWIMDFFNIFLERSQGLLRLDENGSLYATSALIFILLSSIGMSMNTSLQLIFLIPIIVAIIYALLISIMVYADFKLGKNHREEIATYTLYLPFMLALPQTVYHYSFITLLILIPTICYLWQNAPKRPKILILMTIGLCLTQWQAVASFFLTQNVFAYAIPGLGLVMLMLSISIYKFDIWRHTQRAASSVS